MGAWSQFKGEGGEMAKEEEGCVVWGGERVNLFANFVGGGQIKKINMYLTGFY